MKVWIYILVFVMSSLVAVDSQTCPSEHYSAVFTATIDQIVDNPQPGHMDDPELSFFKIYLKFTDSEIQHTIDDAIQFFNNTFGLDFSDPPNGNNERFFQNAKMRPVIITPDQFDYVITDNRWIRTGKTYSSCYFIYDGGFQVTFSGEQTLYDSYGGAEGKPAEMGNSMIYGFYIIDVCKQSPLIIQFSNITPVRREPVDGVSTVTSDIYNRVLGYGKLYTMYGVNPVPGGFHLFARIVFTF